MQWKKRAMFISTHATSFGKTQNNDYQKIYCSPIPASSTTSHILWNPNCTPGFLWKKNVFNGHLVVSGKSVSILKRQLLWTVRFHWFSFFPLRNTPQLMWIVDSHAKINLSNNNSVPTSPTLTSMLTAKIVLWL